MTEIFSIQLKLFAQYHHKLFQTYVQKEIGICNNR